MLCTTWFLPSGPRRSRDSGDGTGHASAPSLASDDVRSGANVHQRYMRRSGTPSVTHAPWRLITFTPVGSVPGGGAGGVTGGPGPRSGRRRRRRRRPARAKPPPASAGRRRRRRGPSRGRVAGRRPDGMRAVPRSLVRGPIAFGSRGGCPRVPSGVEPAWPRAARNRQSTAAARTPNPSRSRRPGASTSAARPTVTCAST